MKLQVWSGFDSLAAPHKNLLQWLSKDKADSLDFFTRLQLAAVIAICQSSNSLAEAGCSLFNISRNQKSSSNDSHRLKHYLAKFGLDFTQLKKGRL